MMVQKEDLGLSLSLSFPQTHHSLQQNLMPCLLPSSASSSSPPPPLSSFNLPKPTWNDAFLSSGSFMGFFFCLHGFLSQIWLVLLLVLAIANHFLKETILLLFFLRIFDKNILTFLAF
jgi:hypothetical protein